MCEIPSRRFNTVFTGLLLGSGSLPPDYANRCVKSPAVGFKHGVHMSFCSVAAHFRQMLPARCVKCLALVLAQYFQAFGLVADHFRQILPADVWNP